VEDDIQVKLPANMRQETDRKKIDEMLNGIEKITMKNKKANGK
jgi:hypothetical protein